MLKGSITIDLQQNQNKMKRIWNTDRSETGKLNFTELVSSLLLIMEKDKI